MLVLFCVGSVLSVLDCFVLVLSLLVLFSICGSFSMLDLFQFLDHIGFCICLGGIYVGFCNADLYFGSFFRCILFRYLSQ